MDYDAWPSLTAMFFEQAGRLADRPLLWSKRDGAWRPQTWGELARGVRALAAALRALGVERGERIVLVSENRPEWLVADFAVMAAGGITVPAYTTNTVADHEHILTDSGAVGAIVSTPALAKRLLPAAAACPGCRWVIAMEPLGEAAEAAGSEDPRVLSWQDALGLGGNGGNGDAEPAAAGRDDVACFIYTSGTGGAPKGVMLSHGNILANCMGAFYLLESFGLGDEVFLSFLPLSHSYEHTAGHMFPLTIGAQIYYAEGADKLLDNLGEVHPTVMTAVPRLYEAMHGRIRRGVQKQGGLKKTLFERAVALGVKQATAPGGLSLAERLQDSLLDRLVRDKVRARFGGRLKGMVSGGAALNPEIGLFFQALGVPVLQGYGQTEAAPVVSANPPGRVKMRTVGPPLRGVEVATAEDGEILVRGALVMKGYWQDEAATALAIRDGWLHTGDVGEIDEDGYIIITDRKKDIIVLSGGDNVSPARIEGLLTMEPEIAQAMVVGDKQSHLGALIVPDQEFLLRWAHEHGKPADLTQLAGDKALHEAVGEAVERANAQLSALYRVRRFALAEAAFSVDNEMMTPTLKIRRHKIQERYGQCLEALFER